MKRLVKKHFSLATTETKWILSLALCFLGSLFLLVLDLSVGNIYTQKTLSSVLATFHFGHVPGSSEPVFTESRVVLPASPARPAPPRFAYLISGSKGEGEKLKRALAALYHPLNQYIVHLDRESSLNEREDLANHVRSNPIFREVGNVHIIVKANLITYRGPTMVSNTLHAAAILLRKSKDWDWFINLSASDYPLVTQDDLIHVFSSVPRNLNFIEHTSRLGWKIKHRANPIIIDPALYMSNKSDIYWVHKRRDAPTAFILFTGSAWMTLSRAFVEYCIWGWDNLPRTLLMYYANFISTPEGYFHTVICNTQEFQNTTVNHDLHYISWDNPPKQHPHNISLSEIPKMIDSEAPFARKFSNESVLDQIDKELLGRQNGYFTPGGWCKRSSDNGVDPCFSIGDKNFLIPSLGAKRLGDLIKRLLSPKIFAHNQCK